MRSQHMPSSSVEQVYLFTGNEEVRARAKMDAIINSLHDEKITITRYDLDLINLNEVIKDAITIPFLADYKVLIIKNPHFLTEQKETIKPEWQMLINYLKKPVETTILIIDAIGYEIASNNEIYKMLQKVAYIKDTQKLDDIEFKGWIVRLLPDEQITIRDDAIECLVEYVKHNYVRMEQEIKKLASFVGRGGTITSNEVKALVNKDLDGDIFQFIQAIVQQNQPLMMKYYQDFKHSTQDIMGIIGLVSKTFRELLTTLKLLKAGYAQHDIALAYEISDGRAYYLVRDAKKFDSQVLEWYVKKMADLDYSIKCGLVDKNLGFELLLFQI